MESKPFLYIYSKRGLLLKGEGERVKYLFLPKNLLRFERWASSKEFRRGTVEPRRWKTLYLAISSPLASLADFETPLLDPNHGVGRNRDDNLPWRGSGCSCSFPVAGARSEADSRWRQISPHQPKYRNQSINTQYLEHRYIILVPIQIINGPKKPTR